MSTTRDLDRLMEAFLEDGPAVLPDRVLEAIADDIDRTDQRAVTGPWRNLVMNRSLFAAAVVTAAVVGGLAIYTVLSQSLNVGPPAESSAPGPSSDDLGALPAELNYPFLGPAKQIEGIDRIDRGDLYFDFYQGRVGYDVGGRTAFYSLSTITADGDLRLTTKAPGTCGDGAVGTYPWSLSPGGTILTIEPGTDDCAVRAAVIPGTYERAACRSEDNDCLGALEAGDYASHYFEPRPLAEWAARHGALSYTVPAGWASFADWPTFYGLTPLAEYEAFDGQDCYECAGDRDQVVILSQPGAATEDCLEEGNVPGVGFDRRSLLDWLVVHPGLVVTMGDNSTIGGFAATSLMIEASEDWTGTCDPENPLAAVPIFSRQDGYHWVLDVGERYHLTLIDLGDGTTVGVIVDTATDADLEAFVDEAMPIIESFEFPAH